MQSNEYGDLNNVSSWNELDIKFIESEMERMAGAKAEYYERQPGERGMYEETAKERALRKNMGSISRDTERSSV